MSEQKITPAISKEAFWSFEGEKILETLVTSINGLSEEEVQKREKIFGTNTFETKRRLSKQIIFLRQFKSPLIFILVVAALVTLFLPDWGSFGVITLAVVLNATLGFYQENKAEEALDHLQGYLQERTHVIRQKREYETDSATLVPGDIVHLSLGNRVPADIRILRANNIMADESILTGESLPIEKNKDPISIATALAERKNMLFGGTLLVQGDALGVVCATGEQSEFGKIAQIISSRQREETPIQTSIRKLAWIITIGLVVAIAGIFIEGILSGEAVIEMFLIVVAMAVGAIPESLPIALTVVLAVGVERLAKKNGIVRKLVAAETLGSTTVVLTDKTGTLTQAIMSLANVSSLDNLIQKDKKDSQRQIKHLSSDQKNIITLALLATDVIAQKDTQGKEQFIGRALEVSLAKEARQHHILLSALKAENTAAQYMPFDSRHKYAAYLLSQKTKSTSFLPWSGAQEMLLFFGAPDVLLDIADVDKISYLAAKQAIEEKAIAGERVLGVGYKKIISAKKDLKKEISDITFFGTISFYDPLREEVKDVMKNIDHFGIRTIIVTGDHKGTAMALGKELGWEINESNVLDGQQLKTLSDEELSEEIEQIKIIARIDPEDKVRIVRVLKNKGEIVAMTGDGVNDAPSLKEADVGIAVGSGTDVAKSVADLVLLDNNFKTIISAIEEGRKILANIKKVVVYLLSSILDEILLVGGSIMLGWVLPIGALQILWVNLFADSFPAISFAFEEGHIPTRSTIIKGKSQIFDKEVKSLLITIGVLTSVGLLVLYGVLQSLGFDEHLVRTFIFASFGLYSLFLVLPLKSLHKSIWEYNPFSNSFMTFGIVLGFVMMVAAIYLPFFQGLLKTVALPLPWVLGVFAVGIINIIIAEITKRFFKQKYA